MNDLTFIAATSPKDPAQRYFACFADSQALAFPATPALKRGCPHRRKVKRGFFQRQHDGRRIQRYVCKDCRASLSDSSAHALYRAQKPWLARAFYLSLNSNSTLRRSALLLQTTRKTLSRYLEIIGKLCQNELDAELAKRPGAVKEVQLDDMETHAHTKLKPLSITLAVDGTTRKVLSLAVSTMPA